MKPHASRNIQLQRTEFVPVAIMRQLSATAKLTPPPYSSWRHERIIPSKLNGKRQKIFAAASSIYAEGATNARKTSHNLQVQYPLRRMVMLRKTVLALLAAVTVAAVGLATAPDASARGGFGGGGFHGGGFGGGFRGGGFGGGFRGGFGGGGFRAAGFRTAGFAGPGWRGGGWHHGFRRPGLIGVGLGLGLAGAYAAYGYPYGYGYGYDPYYAGYYDDGYGYGYGYGGGCYIVRQSVWGPYGPTIRRVQVCN
jgi:hypothetical protein